MYEEIHRKIIDAKHILLVSHQNPDADTLGSALAMYDALKRENKKVSIYCATQELPRIYDFLPNVTKVKSATPKFFDLLISLDCGSFDRLGLDKQDVTLVNIDHHLSNEMFGDINLVDTKSASAGMVVYEFLKHSGFKISADCASCLYVTIVEDTGFFSYSTLSRKTFETAAELIGLGANANEIAMFLKGRVSLAKTRLLGYVYNNFELYFDAKVAVIVISGDILAKTGAKKYDTKNIVNVLRDIITVKVSVLILEERDGSHKVSLRSEGDIDISAISQDFGGGGHKNSAGFNVAEEDCENLKKSILVKLKRIV